DDAHEKLGSWVQSHSRLKSIVTSAGGIPLVSGLSGSVTNVQEVWFAQPRQSPPSDSHSVPSNCSPGGLIGRKMLVLPATNPDTRFASNVQTSVSHFEEETYVIPYQVSLMYPARQLLPPFRLPLPSEAWGITDSEAAPKWRRAAART